MKYTTLQNVKCIKSTRALFNVMSYLCGKILKPLVFVIILCWTSSWDEKFRCNQIWDQRTRLTSHNMWLDSWVHFEDLIFFCKIIKISEKVTLSLQVRWWFPQVKWEFFVANFNLISRKWLILCFHNRKNRRMKCSAYFAFGIRRFVHT